MDAVEGRRNEDGLFLGKGKMKSMMRARVCFALAVSAMSAVAADAIIPFDIAVIPDEVIKSIRSSNRAVIREMKEFRNSQAIVFLDRNDQRKLDSAIAFFDRQRNLGRSPNELMDFFNGLSDVYGRPSHAELPDESAAWRFHAPCKLERGDLVFARSTDIWSGYLANSSLRDKRFSHIAIVLEGGEKPVLLDASLDVDAAETRFCKGEWGDVVGGSIDCAVWRFNGDASVRTRIGAEAEKKVGVPFDPSFSLKTKDRLYCSELVREAVNKAAGREIIGTSRKGDFEYVAVDDCYRNEMTKVWDCRDVKPVVESGAKQSERPTARKQGSRPIVVETASTTNAPVRRTIRFVPKNRR